MRLLTILAFVLRVMNRTVVKGALTMSKRKLLLAVLLLTLAGSATAYFVSLDAPQDFPISI
ncbi:hypothetical protein GCM10008111_01790 [Alishewanella tabrizica]|uniref:Uncharacterized protein n=1 Tax=Alishewanella tabrizica TaxID=671278 RepID=A0ABQ2WCK4_9ALTE|nr:hypothetical protein GCM10008111_01790 [Alishewanella tabrizica]